MACLNDQSWAPSLPEMLSTRLSFKEDIENGEIDANSTPSPFEKVFPVYAMGVSKPNSDPVVLPADSADPIWDAVREEAKLEVPVSFFSFSFFNFYFWLLDNWCFHHKRICVQWV